MAGDIQITVVGNLTADPELRFTQSGQAVCSFTVASTPRTFDRESGKWKDGDATFLRGTIWRQPAENLTESAQRGDRVVVTGRLVQRSYETKEGEKRTVFEIQAEEVALSTKFKPVKVGGAQRSAGRAPDPAGDPWGSDPPAGVDSGRGFNDYPPF